MESSVPRGDTRGGGGGGIIMQAEHEDEFSKIPFLIFKRLLKRFIVEMLVQLLSTTHNAFSCHVSLVESPSPFSPRFLLLYVFTLSQKNCNSIVIRTLKLCQISWELLIKSCYLINLDKRSCNIEKTCINFSCGAPPPPPTHTHTHAHTLP